MCMHRSALHPCFGFGYLGAPWTFRNLFGLDISGQLQQTLGQFFQRYDRKVFQGQRNLQAFITTADLNRQVIG